MKGSALYGRVVFVLPNTEFVFIHNRVHNGALILDAFKFCMVVSEAASKWFERVRSTPNVRANHANLLQYRDNGINPYIIGVPVIA